MTALVNLIERLTADRIKRGRWMARPASLRTHQAHYVGPATPSATRSI